MKNLANEVITERLLGGGAMPSLELMQAARDQSEYALECLRALQNMLQRMVDETSGGGVPCLCTLEHARLALDKAGQFLSCK